MKVVIDYDGVKREISGPFQICIGPDEAEALRQAILEFLDRGGTFGWVTVYVRPPSTTNTAPIGWKDKP